MPQRRAPWARSGCGRALILLITTGWDDLGSIGLLPLEYHGALGIMKVLHAPADRVRSFPDQPLEPDGLSATHRTAVAARRPRLADPDRHPVVCPLHAGDERHSAGIHRLLAPEPRADLRVDRAVVHAVRAMAGRSTACCASTAVFRCPMRDAPLPRTGGHVMRAGCRSR